MGYHIIDKKPKLLLPPGIKVPEAISQELGRHNVVEYTNLRAIEAGIKSSF